MFFIKFSHASSWKKLHSLNLNVWEKPLPLQCCQEMFSNREVKVQNYKRLTVPIIVIVLKSKQLS